MLLSVLAMLCLNFGLFAQTAVPIPVPVGLKLPASFWETKHQFLDQKGVKQTFPMSAFKGKGILIDFWACWCGSCLNHFDALNKIKANYPDLVIIPVNTTDTKDTEERILNLISGKKYPRIELKSPTVINDEILKQYFPHPNYPCYVWVNKDGRVKAITQTFLVTDGNLKELLNEKF